MINLKAPCEQNDVTPLMSKFIGLHQNAQGVFWFLVQISYRAVVRQKQGWNNTSSAKLLIDF